MLNILLGLSLMASDVDTELTNVDQNINYTHNHFYTRDEDVLSMEYIDQKQEELRLQAEEEARIKKEIEEQLKREVSERMERERIASVTFNHNDVTVKSNLTGAEMYNLLKDTGLNDVAYNIVAAEKEYGINSFFIAGIAALESSWGTSNRAVYDNNLTGFNINTSSSKYSFPSRGDSIDATAYIISKHYVSEDGKYFNGKSVKSVNKTYCPLSDNACIGWSKKVTSIAYDLLNKYKSQDV